MDYHRIAAIADAAAGARYDALTDAEDAAEAEKDVRVSEIWADDERLREWAFDILNDAGYWSLIAQAMRRSDYREVGVILTCATTDKIAELA